MLKAALFVAFALALSASAWFVCHAGGEAAVVPPIEFLSTNSPVASVSEIVASATARVEASTPVVEPAHTESAASETLDEFEFDVPFVSGVDGRLLAGAEVKWSPASLAADLASPELIERCALASGEHATTDTNGRIHVIARSHALLVTARVGELWGAAFVPVVSSHPAPIALFPDADLAVRVVDTSGQPVIGAPVVLRSRRRESDGARRGEWCDWFTPVATASAENGVALLRHAGHAIASDSTNSVERHHCEFEWRVALEIAPTQVDSEPLDLASLPTEAITLVMPGTGSVDVRVLDAGRAPHELYSAVALCPARMLGTPARSEDLPDWARGLWSTTSPEVLRASYADGHALFPHVTLGARLAVLARLDHNAGTAWTFFDGPTQHGERLTVELTMSAGRVVLAGRLLGADGAGRGGQSVDFHLGAQPTPGRERVERIGDGDILACTSGTVTADDTGRFRLDFDAASTRGGDALLVLHERERERDAASAIDLTRRWSVGTCELGDIVLAPTPVALAGRVIDESGQPLAGVTLWTSPRGGFARVEARTRDDGLFEMRAPRLSDELEVTALKLAFATTRLAGVAFGTTSLDLVLARGATLSGRIVVPADVQAPHLTVGTGRRDEAHFNRLHAQGAFTLRNVAPGVRDLTVFDDDGASWILRHGLLLESGVTLELGDLELRDQR